MRYYAHFGHTEFVLCLGYGAQAVKDYFLDYRETASNDFVLTKGGVHVELLGTDISDWTITFIDTGMDTAIGERLRRVRPYLEDDEFFLANYGDVLTDAPLNDHIDDFLATDAVAQFLTVSLRTPSMSSNSATTARHGTGPRGGHVHADQRRLLRPAPGHLRLPRRGRRPRDDGCIRAAADGIGCVLELRRLLGADGHAQGADRSRGPVPRGVSPWALWRDHPVEPGSPMIAPVIPQPVITGNGG